MSLLSALSGDTYTVSIRSAIESVERGADEAIEAEQKRRQRFSGACRRRDEHVLAGRKRAPRVSARRWRMESGG